MLWFALLAAERVALSAARRRIRHVVHVNGTRGKSETVRLTAAALRACGFRTLAKSTGTEPRLILPDGTERRIRRLGAADVREQRNLLFTAARLRADVLVAECMAVNPDAQYASHAFLDPDILVITNVRDDHALELGDRETTLRTFAAGIPEGGVLVIPEADGADAGGTGITDAGAAGAELARYFAEAARKRGVAVRRAVPLEGTAARFAENAGAAMEAVRACGVADHDLGRALEGMRDFARDPGAFRVVPVQAAAGGTITFVDALSANDPESTSMVLRKALGVKPSRAEPIQAEPSRAERPGASDFTARVLLLSMRGDRPDRSIAFAEWALQSREEFGWDRVVVIGHAPARAWRTLRNAFGAGAGSASRHGSGLAAARMRDLEALVRGAPPGSLVCAAGNWKGAAAQLDALARPGMRAHTEQGARG